MVKLRMKLSGTTLIETLVAMTIIVTGISLSFSSVISIKKSYNNDLRTAAFMAANKQVQIEEKDSISVDYENIDYASFSIRISRTLYDNDHNLYVLDIKALTQDSIVLYETREILKTHSLVKNTKGD